MVVATALAEQVGIVFQILLAPSTFILGPDVDLALSVLGSLAFCTCWASTAVVGALLVAFDLGKVVGQRVLTAFA